MRKKQLSDDIRNLVCSKYDDGKSPTVIARELNINVNTIRTILNVYKANGRVIAKKRRNPKPLKISLAMQEFIREKISDDVSITLRSLKSSLLTERGISVSKSTIARSIDAFNFSFKRVVLIPEARNSYQNIEFRYTYANEYLSLDENKVIFIDEMGVNISMRCTYGRSLIGISPRKKVKAIRSKNYSISAAITKSGLIRFKTINKAFTGESYSDFILEVLEILQATSQLGFTFIMDNCAIHKVSSVRSFIENSGHNLLFLPPYSPQLNPIEEFFSKWKHNIKVLNVVNVEDLLIAIQNSCDKITINDCTGYFAHVRQFALKSVRREEL